MKDKINIAELLKDCPEGMPLDCTMFENVTFIKIQDSSYPIIIHTPDGYKYLTAFGCYHNSRSAKCVIFPKGKTIWEGFVPPKFKDGDILAVADTVYIYNGIEELSPSPSHYVYVIVDKNGLFAIDTSTKKYGTRFATEEEKAKLFQVIKDNGYRWNPETKTLERLPEFKVGNKIRNKNTGEIFKIDDINMNIGVYCCGFDYIQISYQDKYELVLDKFDITTLKPFDKVLVRDNINEKWNIHFFSCIDNAKMFKTIMGTYIQCIPFEGNEHLLDTTKKCDDYFKTWKDE